MRSMLPQLVPLLLLTACGHGVAWTPPGAGLVREHPAHRLEVTTTMDGTELLVTAHWLCRVWPHGNSRPGTPVRCSDSSAAGLRVTLAGRDLGTLDLEGRLRRDLRFEQPWFAPGRLALVVGEQVVGEVTPTALWLFYEETDWALVSVATCRRSTRADQCRDVASFLERYPGGAHAAEARAALEAGAASVERARAEAEAAAERVRAEVEAAAERARVEAAAAAQRAAERAEAAAERAWMAEQDGRLLRSRVDTWPDDPGSLAGVRVAGSLHEHRRWCEHPPSGPAGSWSPFREPPGRERRYLCLRFLHGRAINIVLSYARGRLVSAARLSDVTRGTVDFEREVRALAGAAGAPPSYVETTGSGRSARWTVRHSDGQLWYYVFGVLAGPTTDLPEGDLIVSMVRTVDSWPDIPAPYLAPPDPRTQPWSHGAFFGIRIAGTPAEHAAWCGALREGRRSGRFATERGSDRSTVGDCSFGRSMRPRWRIDYEGDRVVAVAHSIELTGEEQRDRELTRISRVLGSRPTIDEEQCDGMGFRAFWRVTAPDGSQWFFGIDNFTGDYDAPAYWVYYLRRVQDGPWW